MALAEGMTPQTSFQGSWQLQASTTRARGWRGAGAGVHHGCVSAPRRLGILILLPPALCCCDIQPNCMWYHDAEHRAQRHPRPYSERDCFPEGRDPKGAFSVAGAHKAHSNVKAVLVRAPRLPSRSTATASRASGGTWWWWARPTMSGTRGNWRHRDMLHENPAAPDEDVPMLPPYFRMLTLVAFKVSARGVR